MLVIQGDSIASFSHRNKDTARPSYDERGIARVPSRDAFFFYSPAVDCSIVEDVLHRIRVKI